MIEHSGVWISLLGFMLTHEQWAFRTSRGQKFLVGMTLQPPSFLPARAFSFGSAARSAAISRDFVQNEF